MFTRNSDMLIGHLSLDPLVRHHCGMREIEVRVALASEWETVRTIRLQALCESPEAFGSSLARESVMDEGTWLGRISSGHWVLAWINGQPCGVAAGVVDRESGDHELVGLWVVPDRRGNGVATALIESIRSWATDLHAETLVLRVVETNMPAQRLYARFGFVRTGQRAPVTSHPERSEERLRLTLR